MKRNFKLVSIFKDKQISSKFKFLMIVVSNILWISLFYISFNKLSSSNNSDDIEKNGLSEEIEIDVYCGAVKPLFR